MVAVLCRWPPEGEVTPGLPVSVMKPSLVEGNGPSLPHLMELTCDSAFLNVNGLPTQSKLALGIRERTVMRTTFLVVFLSYLPTNQEKGSRVTGRWRLQYEKRVSRDLLFLQCPFPKHIHWGLHHEHW